jgi:A/G-specific adenine glycosylase
MLPPGPTATGKRGEILRKTDLSRALLRWYDANARDLPWRIGPGERARGVVAQPYRVWLSEVMLQQTTVAAVDGYFRRFTARWPDVQALAASPDEAVMAQWAGLGYYARARNLLKCARLVVADLDGRFPDTYDQLIRLPGIGPYTAAAIAAIAFEQPECVVDGNVERVMARFHAVRETLDIAKPALAALARKHTPNQKVGDYAQAIMDLGATLCTPKSPKCGACPWRDACRANRLGIAEQLPRRKAKLPKPTRQGIAYLVRRADGAWLLERRPDSGLLGGMLGWPGAEWGRVAQQAPPLPADWQIPTTQVRHTFTHFHLHLSLRVANVGANAAPSVGEFIPQALFDPSDLPTVMRKAHDIAAEYLDDN